jgi:uncharacterized protein
MNSNDEFQDLVRAVRLPSHELACKAFEKIPDIDARLQVDQSNILYFIIEYYKGEHLRVADFKKLIELGADINARNKVGHTPLHYCVMHPLNFDMAQILVDYKAQIDEQDNDGNTPLWTAVMRYRGQQELLQIILLLLKNGADIEKSNHHGVSPKDIVTRRQESILDGGAKKEWDLSEYLSEYL